MSQPNFPNSPQPGDTYTYSGSVWTWTGAYWRVLQGVAATGGSIVPAANVAYDLGSNSLRWRDLYLSGNTIDLGGTAIKSSATGVSFTSAANAQATVALTVSSIQLSTGGNTVTLVAGTSGLQTVGNTGNAVPIAGGGFTFSNTAPTSPTVGSRWLDSDSGKEFVYITTGNVSTWVQPIGPFGSIPGLTGLTASLAGLSANDLMIRNNYTAANNGLYFITNYGSIAPTQHYCLFDTAFAGGGWTLLMTQTSANNFAAGTNYAFSVTTGTPSRSSAYGLDRRNTFTPQAGDEFLIIRESTGEWVRFVVSSWSPTANNVANRWETTNTPAGTNTSHPYWAAGQMYNSSGSAVSGFIHFNGCAIGGNCGGGGADGAGFGNHQNWLYGTGGSGAYGGGFNGGTNGGATLYWNTTSVDGTALTWWFKRPGT